MEAQVKSLPDNRRAWMALVGLALILVSAGFRLVDRNNDVVVPRGVLSSFAAPPTLPAVPTLPASVQGPAGDSPIVGFACAQFGTQRIAQTFFEQMGGPDTDRYRWDQDGDGLACEQLL